LANRRAHKPWLITATGAAPGASSVSVNPRPSASGGRTTLKKLPDASMPDVTTGVGGRRLRP
jgi:hypothetical protein